MSVGPFGENILAGIGMARRLINWNQARSATVNSKKVSTIANIALRGTFGRFVSPVLDEPQVLGPSLAEHGVVDSVLNSMCLYSDGDRVPTRDATRASPHAVFVITIRHTIMVRCRPPIHRVCQGLQLGRPPMSTPIYPRFPATTRQLTKSGC